MGPLSVIMWQLLVFCATLSHFLLPFFSVHLPVMLFMLSARYYAEEIRQESALHNAIFNLFLAFTPFTHFMPLQHAARAPRRTARDKKWHDGAENNCKYKDDGLLSRRGNKWPEHPRPPRPQMLPALRSLSEYSIDRWPRRKRATLAQ